MTEPNLPLPEALVRIVADAFLFFEKSSDEDLDPDVAVQHLEVIAYYLRRLSPEDRREVIDLVRKIEAEAPAAWRGWGDEFVDGLFDDADDD